MSDTGLLCDTCGIGFFLPSGRCDHCNVQYRAPLYRPPGSDSDRIKALQAELKDVFEDNRRLREKNNLLQIDIDLANCARQDALTALEAFQEYDGNEELWAAMKRERDQLRRILSHVPGKIAIQAKEKAGFPNYVHIAKAGQ
jgi:hypothetical protein